MGHDAGGWHAVKKVHVKREKGSSEVTAALDLTQHPHGKARRHMVRWPRAAVHKGPQVGDGSLAQAHRFCAEGSRRMAYARRIHHDERR